MTFKSGDQKPANSGMRKGQKTRKVIEREQAKQRAEAEFKENSRKYMGMDPADILEAEEFSIIYGFIDLYRNGQDEQNRFKALTELKKIFYPDLKSIEAKHDVQSRVEVVFGDIPVDVQIIESAIDAEAEEIEDQTDDSLFMPPVLDQSKVKP